MSLFDQIKKVTKKAAEDFNSEKINSIKNDAAQKVKDLKEEYDKNQKNKKENGLDKREEALNLRAKYIDEREDALARLENALENKTKALQKESKRLKAKENKPKHVFIFTVVVCGIIYYVSTADFSTLKNSASKTPGLSKVNVEPAAKTNPVRR